MATQLLEPRDPVYSEMDEVVLYERRNLTLECLRAAIDKYDMPMAWYWNRQLDSIEYEMKKRSER